MAGEYQNVLRAKIANLLSDYQVSEQPPGVVIMSTAASPPMPAPLVVQPQVVAQPAAGPQIVAPPSLYQVTSGHGSSTACVYCCWILGIIGVAAFLYLVYYFFVIKRARDEEYENNRALIYGSPKS